MKRLLAALAILSAVVAGAPAALAEADIRVAIHVDENDPTKMNIVLNNAENIEKYYAKQGKQVEIIKLYGSMELAPIVRLADYIVDLVDTGNTLKANGLEPQEHIADISSRLIVNKASMKMKHKTIQSLIDTVATAVK